MDELETTLGFAGWIAALSREAIGKGLRLEQV
jgi:hypothetical protein